MRIGMIAPLEMRVPPVAYGGTELVVSLLTNELVHRGHDVTLFASGDSITSAKLKSVCDRYLRHSGRDIHIVTAMNVAACLEMAGEFDIIHNHTAVEGLAMAGLSPVPVLSTLHGAMKGDLQELFLFHKGWYNTISHSAKSLLPVKLEDKFVGVVYNAIDWHTFPFNRGPRENYLLFLSRISDEKGPHLAIEVAQRLGMPLIMAGNIDNLADRAYFEAHVKPHIDGHLVRYIGEADAKMKRELLSRARCLLAPITWPEPFGLFMVEAMACGTPVIAFNRGAAPEVVLHGSTGYIVETADEMASMVGQIGHIDPQQCRDHVRERFGVERLCDDYLAAYEHVLAAAQSRAIVPTLNGPDAIAQAKSPAITALRMSVAAPDTMSESGTTIAA